MKIFNHQILKSLLATLLIALLTSGVYLNSLNNSFYFDDHHSILNNPHVRVLGNITDFFTKPEMFSGDKDSSMYRPILLVTYALNYKIGGYNPLVYHSVNILLHTLNTLLVYFILISLLSISFHGSRLTAQVISALLASLLFGVHTLNTQSVNYISSRSVLLATFFYLFSFYLYIKAKAKGQGSGVKGQESTVYCLPSTVCYSLSLLFFALSLLSKEIAITLPLTLLLYDYLLSGIVGAGFTPPLLGGASPPPTPGQTHRSAPTYFLLSTIYYRLRFHLPYWAVGIGYLVIRKLLLGQAVITVSWETVVEGKGVSRSIYINLLTQAKANLFYIKSLFLPTGLSVEHYMEEARGIGEPFVLFSILVIILLIVSAILLHRRNWGISFGILWFFITIMPETVLPLNVIINEHRTYLPMIGFAVFCGFLFDRIKEWFYVGANLCVRPYRAGLALPIPQGRHAGLPLLSTILLPTFYFLIALFIFFNAFGTISRNRVWKDEYTLWKDAIEKYPGSARAHANFGVTLYERGMIDEAILEYKEALKLRPFAGASPHLHYNLARAYQEKRLFDEAIAHYKKAINYGLGNNADTRNNLGNVYAEKGLLEEAINEYKEALRIDPTHSLAIKNLSIVTKMLEQKTSAKQNSTTKPP